ncbi:WcaG Nucleoside-diphosphate-sugar epimerases [Candidatus Methylopumilus planktonicus]|uniref:NAD-dependent epimerase/dehydratase family protein n=1 Tax=Candidatus Methylopumilus planktonicus TaxID=1581557 RepID=UPI003BEF14E5
MATLLVIGGSGFFGKSILDMFQRGGLAHWNVDKVIAMSRNAKRLQIETPELVKGNVDLVELDITTTKYLPEADYVIHAAASTDARNYLSAGEKERENIQAGTLNYCRLVRNNKNTKTLYVSSGAIYGTQPPEISHIEESYCFKDPNDIPEGKQDYAVAKRDAEELIKELGKEGFSVSIARCFAFIGKFLPRDQHFAIGNFIADGLARKSIKVKANHLVYRSYMYADDLVEWLMTIVNNASPTCPIYNVGSDQEVLINDLAHIVGNIFGVMVQESSLNLNYIDRYLPSIKKAKLNLNLDIKFNLESALTETIKKITQ